ncbi:hypothetical protein [Candidatus Hakubella thermalkaliphila]|uniref:hypothetical protein n=1 Tax=Candidatus Hakubella thermalkaliphila TaxID=2754717 RepID=UPI00387E399B
MLLGDLHQGQHQPEDQIIAKLALIAENETQDDHFGFAIGSFADNYALLDQGLINLTFDLGHYITQTRQRDDHFGRHQRRAKTPDHHQLEAILPLMLSDTLAEDLGFTQLEKLR